MRGFCTPFLETIPIICTLHAYLIQLHLKFILRYGSVISSPNTLKKPVNGALMLAKLYKFAEVHFLEVVGRLPN